MRGKETGGEGVGGSGGNEEKEVVLVMAIGGDGMRGERRGKGLVMTGGGRGDEGEKEGLRLMTGDDCGEGEREG